MIEFLWLLLKTLFAMVPLVLLFLLSGKVNLDKTIRSRQFLMPLIALVFSLILMPLLGVISEGLITLIRQIPVWLKALAEVGWMPQSVSGALSSASEGTRSGIERMQLNYWVFFIGNTLIMLLFLLVKRICIAVFARKFKEQGTFHDKVAGVFYEYFAERNIWCLRNEYGNARVYLKTFYWAAVIISSLLFLISAAAYRNGLLNAMFYPVFCVIVVGECFFFIDGSTRKEYICDVLGENEESFRTVNYSLLRKFLRNLFTDKLLTENTLVNNILPAEETNDEIIQRLEYSDDPKISAFGAFVKRMNREGMKIDHNYLRSSLDLLNGKSILFNNPFCYDLIPYAFYPMNRVLLRHRKVLVVLGRHATEKDAEKWLAAGVESVTNIPYLWKIAELGKAETDPDIGIVTRSDIFNAEMLDTHREFLEQVEFICIIEPSKLISTAQIGLNLLMKKCRQGEKKEITFCLIDKNCDGLVDSMSHVLMTNLTEVSATQKNYGTMSYMCWEADEEYLHHRIVPNISRYLGLGTELSFVALKNQVAKTSWFGGEAFPVYDISWIDKQYYYDLADYAGISADQNTADERMAVSANLWNAKKEKNAYITAEDESFNMFEVLRDFSTRSSEQGFVNVISSEYLLKDYMADNAALFESDAKAIPCIVADYVRSNRNTLLKLMLMLNAGPVEESVLTKELSLLGVKIRDLRKQLWFEIYKYFSDAKTIAALPEDYWTAVETVCGKEAPAVTAASAEPLTIDLLREKERYNIYRNSTEIVYYLEKNTTLDALLTELKSAEYITEDEKGQKNFLGAELCGHIYQKYLPGQFFTFGGKYYEMLHLTAEGQVLLRRAADHINGRVFYRQIRDYEILGVNASDQIGAVKNISGMKIAKEYADLSVRTRGYYRMNRYNNFADAKKILFEGEKNGIPQRLYRQKEILRIELPAGGEVLSAKVLSTVTLLFNEVFRTLFAENQPYICAVCPGAVHSEEERNFLTYSLSGEKLSGNSIYIIEDSQLDLGLISAVERNLERIFQIVTDYLNWHKDYLKKSLEPEPPAEPVTFTTEVPEEAEEKKKKGFFRRGIDAVKGFFRRIFRRKKKNASFSKAPSGEMFRSAETGNTPVAGNAPAENGITPDKPESPVESGAAPAQPESPVENGAAPAQPDPADDDGTITYVTEDEVLREGDKRIRRKPYHQRYFLLYGYEELSTGLDIEGTLEYLSGLDFAFSPLKQARDGKNIAEMIEQTYDPRDPNRRFCDFCGVEIMGVEYETLADGRDRCLQCGKTAVKTGEEFRKIFAEVKRNMESFYGIQINTGIRVEMINAQKLHKRLGETFVPTPGFDGRTLGVAIRERSGAYIIYVENGAPRVRSMMTMAHELTHIWQYLNWDSKLIAGKYGKEMHGEIYEGMAKWAEIQYAYLINETAMAKREEINSMLRNDEYGRGFLRYLANYPLTYGTVLEGATPFMDRSTPLDPHYCGAIGVPVPVMTTIPTEPQTEDGETPKTE